MVSLFISPFLPILTIPISIWQQSEERVTKALKNFPTSEQKQGKASNREIRGNSNFRLKTNELFRAADKWVL